MQENKPYLVAAAWGDSEPSLTRWSTLRESLWAALLRCVFRLGHQSIRKEIAARMHLNCISGRPTTITTGEKYGFAAWRLTAASAGIAIEDSLTPGSTQAVQNTWACYG